MINKDIFYLVFLWWECSSMMVCWRSV